MGERRLRQEVYRAINSLLFGILWHLTIDHIAAVCIQPWTWLFVSKPV